MARQRKEKKDRTGVIISVVAHALVIGAVLFWLSSTESGRDFARKIIEAIRPPDKPTEPPKEQPQARTPDKPLPKINEGADPPKRAGGARRAVAADAPAAAGDTFFSDTRTQGKESAGGSGEATEKAKAAEAGPTRPPPPPKPVFTGAAAPSNIKAALAERAKAAAAIESYSAEQISKSSVSDAGDIVSKVAGAAVVDGKYAVIRGLTDRYSAATLNGAELPSADPYRRSAGLDMFPAKIIDRVTVTKTFTPDQPGSFTGGNINIITKSFPEKPFFTLEVGGSYNTQSSFNDDFLTYPGGGLDWLGMDDGSRALPSSLQDFNLRIPPRVGTVTLNRPTTAAQLANVNQLDQLTKELGPTQFAGTPDKSPLNHNIVFAGGDTTRLFGRPLGYFASMPYLQQYSFYNDGEVQRYSYVANSDGQVELRKSSTETRGVAEVNWAGTVNLAYQPFDDHEVSYNFLYNQYSEDVARQRTGIDLTLDPDGKRIVEQNRLQFTERNLTSQQFKGSHYPRLFEGVLNDIKFDWLATFSETTQDEPNARFYNTVDGQFGDAALPDPARPTRYYRDLTENNRNLKFDFTVPYYQWSRLVSDLKFGLFDSTSERQYNERIFTYDSDNRGSIPDPNSFLLPGHLGHLPPTTNGTRVTYVWPNYLAQPLNKSFYNGDATIQAGYLMTDMPLFELDAPATVPFFGGRLPLLQKVRLIGGVRYETTDIQVESFSTVPTVNSPPGQTNNAVLKENALLPAASLVFSMNTNMSVRMSYGETLARPSFRELAGIRSYDPVLDEILEGNPRLQITTIKNFDVRWEWFPRPGELYSVAWFRKDLRNVIEKEYLDASGDVVTFANQPKATVTGWEFEFRKSLDFLDARLRNFTFAGNLSLIQSEAPIPEDEQQVIGGFITPAPTSRPLADQSPYIINAELAYDNSYSGTSVSLSYNIFGPRIIITSLNSPDIYEQPAPSLDLVISQRLGRNLKLKFGARNLLDPKVEKTYGEDSQAIYSSYRRGRTFGLSLTYDF